MSQLFDTTSITTDQSDYAPDSIAEITLNNIRPGSTAIFQVEHVVAAGMDGNFGTQDDLLGDQSGQGHAPWIVTDGSDEDLDGLRNGSIVTAWHVDPDDSLDATFRLTASTLLAGKDRRFGTADDVCTAQTASTSFTFPLARAVCSRRRSKRRQTPCPIPATQSAGAGG